MTMRKWSYLIALSCVLSGSALAECPPAVSASQVDVYPSAETVPANLLRFYLYFPRRMSREIAGSDIRLVSSDGREVSQAFLPMRYDLWSSDRRRLTLMLDPGRVKTGLASHETFGQALTLGERFELQVLGSVKDSNGCSLGADTSFGFSVLAAEREPLMPEAWSIEVPATGSKEALKINLGRPHDHLSMAYRIRVLSEDGQSIAGRIGLEANESVWTFEPREAWIAAKYEITIDERLEDLAGNRPGVVFDRAPNVSVQDWTREIKFVPRPGD